MGYGTYAVGLVGCCRCYVAEGRIPACRSASRQIGQYAALLVFGEEWRYLQYALTDDVVDGHVKLVIVYLQHVVEDVVDKVVAVHYLYVFLAHNHSRQVALYAEVDHGMGFVKGYEVFAHGMVAVRAECSCGEYVAVHYLFHLANVVEQLARTTRSRKYLNATVVSLVQRLDCRLGYAVGIEADERAVNIKEHCFYHITGKGTQKMPIIQNTYS